MPKKLPTMIYKKKKYFIDFKLEELREVKTGNPLKFTQIPGGAKSKVKAKLRGYRARTWGQRYIRGLDD